MKALALFVAPALLDAAFDASPRDLRANWRPVAGLALGAVALTIVAVAVVTRAFVPGMLTTNLDRANLAGTATAHASPEECLPEDSIALAFQMRAVPKAALDTRVRTLTEVELAELELTTDEALGRIVYETDL